MAPERVIQSWNTAAKMGELNDYSVGTTWAIRTPASRRGSAYRGRDRPPHRRPARDGGRPRPSGYIRCGDRAPPRQSVGLRRRAAARDSGRRDSARCSALAGSFLPQTAVMHTVRCGWQRWVQWVARPRPAKPMAPSGPLLLTRGRRAAFVHPINVHRKEMTSQFGSLTHIPPVRKRRRADGTMSGATECVAIGVLWKRTDKTPRRRGNFSRSYTRSV
jgi:hypothetical protein